MSACISFFIFFQTITSEKPEEECSLEPRVECKHVTKLVPQLKPTESCTDVPKEVCARTLANPRKVSKPVVKRWCYVPSEESGLDPGSGFNSRPDNQGKGQSQSPSNSNTCPRSCLEAKRSGVCDPRCNQYARECNIPVCRPPPPTTTTTTTTTPAPPACPRSCRRGFQNNNRCEPQCDIPECGYDPDCSAPVCPATCRPGFQSNGRCQPECDIPECGLDPDCRAPVCPSSCRPGFQSNGRCQTECNVPLCGYDPDCDPKPFNPTTTTTTRRPAPTPPACPSSCRRGFQTNGRCEVQCHTAACGYDPDCNKPVQEPENVYLPPDRNACPPGVRGCGGASAYGGLAPPPANYNRRGGRRNTARLPANTSLVNRAGRGNSGKVAFGTRIAPKSPRNNWDLFFQSGIISDRSG